MHGKEKPRPGVASVLQKIAVALGAVTLFVPSDARPDPFELAFSELAPGVWTGIREGSTRLPVTGNAVFVISDEGVVVFDGGSVPLMSERLIAKIRELTDRPVTHVAVSHWHGDHNLGIHRFLEEFAAVEVIGHPFTRAAMLGSPMDYARKRDRARDFIPTLSRMVETGADEEGHAISNTARQWYADAVTNADIIDREYQRAEITPPKLLFEDKLVLWSGDRRIEFLYLGDGNTAGDIVMWLPEERIVATGDLVVLPTPYGFNVPPRKWARTLRNLQALGYGTLVPGHGEVQHDTAYVDLLIETAESIAEQRDGLLESGLDEAEVQDKLDFSNFRERYTHGDILNGERFDEWFAQPFAAAALKALAEEPMVVVGPSKFDAYGELIEDLE